MLRAAMRNATCMVDAAHAAGFGGYREEDVGWVIAAEIPHPALNAVRPLRQHAGLVDRIPDIVATYPDHVPVAWWVVTDDGHDELNHGLGDAGFDLAAAMPAIAGSIPADTPDGPFAPPTAVKVDRFSLSCIGGETLLP